MNETCDDCKKCLDEVILDNGLALSGICAVYCHVCGEKECQRALDHNLECNGGADQDPALLAAKRKIQKLIDPIWQIGGFRQTKLYIMIGERFGDPEYDTYKIKDLLEAELVLRIVEEIHSLFFDEKPTGSVNSGPTSHPCSSDDSTVTKADDMKKPVHKISFNVEILASSWEDIAKAALSISRNIEHEGEAHNLWFCGPEFRYWASSKIAADKAKED